MTTNIRRSTLLIITIGCITLAGCNITEKLGARQSKSKFKSLCASEQLAICGDTIPLLQPTNINIHDLQADLYRQARNYIYTSDKGDTYTYMYPDVNGTLRGDCEDYIITAVENNVRNGNIVKDEVEIMYGKIDGVYHVWGTITKDDITILVDNGYIDGIDVDVAYNVHNYNRVSTVVRY